jgi:hypothetical protein
MPFSDKFVLLLITFKQRISNHLLEVETMTSGDCGSYASEFVSNTILALLLASVLPIVITIPVIIIVDVVRKDKRRSAYQILEEILAKADLEERNEAFLDACVEYSKGKHGKKPFDRKHGIGKLDEVYSHFIKMESKELEEKRKAEGESGAKVSNEEIALKEASEMV